MFFSIALTVLMRGSRTLIIVFMKSHEIGTGCTVSEKNNNMVCYHLKVPITVHHNIFYSLGAIAVCQ